MPDTTETSESTGLVVITVTDRDGKVKSQQTSTNLITDAGDAYHVARIASAVVPAALADAGKVTGMKLGIGTLAATKAGAGGALVSYVSGGNAVFDAGFPTVQSLGPGLGSTVTYQTTFGAGVGTAAALTEVVIVTDAATDATSDVAHTVSRVVFAATPKGATDTLSVGWSHKQLGS